jgi:dolichyl-phosphate-mannose--protein O-mannosyl transferase
MNTIKIIGFGGNLNQDELEFQIPHDYTCKMISHLRLYPDWLGVQIHISPMEGNQINRDCDTFFIHENGDKEKRTKIKQSINKFCESQKLEPPTWRENY